MAEFPFDLLMFTNFSNWAAQLCGISREALQQNTFDSVVMCNCPIISSKTGRGDTKKNLVISVLYTSLWKQKATTSQFPNLASLGARALQWVKRC